MIYMTGALNATIRPHVNSGLVGVLDTPANSFHIGEQWTYAADNGCFGKGYPGDDEYLAWLAARRPGMWATAPDVVGDHAATLARSLPMLARIRAAGWPAAFIAQNGSTPDNVPWDDCDAVFIGGDTDWKLGADARAVVAEAKRRGKWVHMGRVNSGKRWRYAEAIGCDSVDGTYLAFGPERNTPRLLDWVTSRPLDLHEGTNDSE